MKNSKETRLTKMKIEKMRGSTNWARLIQEENAEKDNEHQKKREETP